MKRTRRRGGALVIALVTLLVISSTMMALIHALVVDLRQTRQAVIEVQANCLADAALARGAAQLRRSPEYSGESWRASTAHADDAATTGVAEIRVEKQNDNLRIVVDVQYPDHPTRRVLTTRKLTFKP